MLSPREAFKAGFIARCAALGMSDDQMLKTAQEVHEKMANLLASLGNGLNTAVGQYGLPLALAAPPVLGAAGGYALARATDLSDHDVDEIKDQELLDTYDTETSKLNRKKATRDYRKKLLSMTQRRPAY